MMTITTHTSKQTEKTLKFTIQVGTHQFQLFQRSGRKNIFIVKLGPKFNDDDDDENGMFDTLLLIILII